MIHCSRHAVRAHPEKSSECDSGGQQVWHNSCGPMATCGREEEEILWWCVTRMGLNATAVPVQVRGGWVGRKAPMADCALESERLWNRAGLGLADIYISRHIILILGLSRSVLLSDWRQTNHLHRQREINRHGEYTKGD